MRLATRGADYLWFLRSWLRRWHYDDDGDVTATIVVVPGIYEGQSQLGPLAASLNKAGYRIVVIRELASLSASTSSLAQLLAERISQLSDPVVILAHSKGGLVGRAVLVSRPDLPQLRGMVTIATPWHGSSLARYFPRYSPVRRLAPAGSDLEPYPGDHRQHSKIYSLNPSWDPHVPQGSFLPGAHNISLSSAGHFYPLGTQETQSAVHDAVRNLLSGR